MLLRRTGISLLVFVFASFFLYAFLARGIKARATIYTKRASQLLKEGQLPQARKQLEWLLWLEPDHIEAGHITGLTYLEEKNFSAAIPWFHRVPTSHRHYEGSQLLLIACLLGDYQMERAETRLREHIREYPDSVSAHLQLSGLLEAQLRLQEACGTLLSFVQRKTGKTLSLRDRVRMLQAIARIQFDPPVTDSYVEMLETSLSRHPGQCKVLSALAMCYWKTGDLASAERSFKELQAAECQVLTCQFPCVPFLVQIGDLQTARTILSVLPLPNGAHQYDTAYAVSRWTTQSQLDAKLGDLSSALVNLESALLIRPFKKELHSRRARLLQQLGRADDARAAYKTAFRLAKVDLDMWELIRSMPEIPPPEMCRSAATLYKSRGETTQADKWFAVADEIATTMTRVE